MSTCERSRKRVLPTPSTSPPKTRCSNCGGLLSAALIARLAATQLSSRRQALGAARRRDQLGVERRRRGDKRGMARRLAIVTGLLAFEVGQPSAGLVEDEIGRGDIPVIGF